MNKELMEAKINCYKIKDLLLNQEIRTNMCEETIKILNTVQNTKIFKYVNSTSEVHEDCTLLDKILTDIRTYICHQSICKHHYKRSHVRITTYNYNKMKKLNFENYTYISRIAKDIIQKFKTDTIINNQELSNIEDNREHTAISIDNTRLTFRSSGFKYINFVKESTSTTEKRNETKTEKYKPIETVFTKIDKIAEENSRETEMQKARGPPGKEILQSNNYRMSYGDLNYIGSNKAIFYFDRGIRGKQIFTNSMYSLKYHPPYKDLIVIDDIVFTATCKCDSAIQHQKMFPHYRVTCAPGLTCPARFNNSEKIIYIRNKNAPAGKYTTARAMLIRYW